MRSHEKEKMEQEEEEEEAFLEHGRAVGTPGIAITGPTKANKRGSPAGRVCLAIVALLGTFLFVSSVRGCRLHQHHHDSPPDPPSSGKWAAASDNVHPAGAVTSEPGSEAGRLLREGSLDVQVHRQQGKLGMIRRQSASSSSSSSATSTTAASSSGTVLVDFQVHQPVLTPEGATLDSGVSNGEAGEVQDSCQVVLMDHVFAYSYGEPYIGAYTPPDCDFNRVAINFTVVSEGRQFDRLALMYFNDTEVWRTSTAEPTAAPGIRWTYLKDMTEYLSLWNAPQKLIFDLGNLITDVYTGDFNTTLTATFFLDDSVDVATASPADLIIPISARQSASDGVSQFTLPADNATNTIAFPQNARRAVFSVSANGQANEEFWWSNVLQSDVATFAATAGTFPGYSPWREVQVWIDGQLAGVDWPFPVVFTGGVVPSLHRPVVGPDAFDLKEHEIDITPWLGVLCDGADHTFTIYVAGLLDDGGSGAAITQTVGSSWYVTGKIFVWLDADASSITTGTAPVVVAAPPAISVSQALTTSTTSANGTVNETLAYDTAVSRSYAVSATITTGSGGNGNGTGTQQTNRSSVVGWTQSLSYSNRAYVWAQGYAQINDVLTSGTDVAGASADGVAGANYKTEYRYPLYCNTSYAYSAAGNLTIFADLVQGQQVYVEGAAVFPDGLEAFAVAAGAPRYSGSLANNSKEGVAYFFEYADASYSSGYGSTDETFTFGGFTGTGGGSIDAVPDKALYSRHVEAANSTVTADVEVLAEADVAAGGGGDDTSSSASSGSKSVYAQTPLQGGSGAPRLFMNRQSS